MQLIPDQSAGNLDRIRQGLALWRAVVRQGLVVYQAWLSAKPPEYTPVELECEKMTLLGAMDNLSKRLQAPRTNVLDLRPVAQKLVEMRDPEVLLDMYPPEEIKTLEPELESNLDLLAVQKTFKTPVSSVGTNATTTNTNVTTNGSLFGFQ